MGIWLFKNCERSLLAPPVPVGEWIIDGKGYIGLGPPVEVVGLAKVTGLSTLLDGRPIESRNRSDSQNG